jgi:hypothetical protein
VQVPRCCQRSKALDEAPYKLSGAVAKLASITFWSLPFSYWTDKPWFLTEGKFATVLIIPSFWGSQLDGDLHQHRAASMFHVAAGEKLHADKHLSGAIVRSVAKLAGINLRKCGSFSYGFDKPWFHN